MPACSSAHVGIVPTSISITVGNDQRPRSPPVRHGCPCAGKRLELRATGFTAPASAATEVGSSASKQLWRRSEISVVLVALSLPLILFMSVALVIPIMLAVTPAVALTVAWHVHLVVPGILHEVDRLAAGVVLAARISPQVATK